MYSVLHYTGKYQVSSVQAPRVDHSNDPPKVQFGEPESEVEKQGNCIIKIDRLSKPVDKNWNASPP